VYREIALSRKPFRTCHMYIYIFCLEWPILWPPRILTFPPGTPVYINTHPSLLLLYSINTGCSLQRNILKCREWRWIYFSCAYQFIIFAVMTTEYNFNVEYFLIWQQSLSYSRNFWPAMEPQCSFTVFTRAHLWSCLQASGVEEKLKLQWMLNYKFCEERIAYFLLIRHVQHSKRRVQQFCYCCVCIRCRGKVFTEPLLSNDRGIHIQTKTDGKDLWSMSLRWAQFHIDWFRHSKVHGEGRTDTQTVWLSHKPTFIL
jgi:hypothetical protein